MNSKVQIQDFIQKMGQINKTLLEFLDNESSKNEDFHNLISIISSQHILEDKYKFKTLLLLISKIFQNHHRSTNFISKIELILIQFSNLIQRYFTNDEIFDIFKSNRRIILFLIKEKLLNLNEKITAIISNTNKPSQINYIEYLCQKNEENDSQLMNDKLSIGENDSYICELIRNDSIDDFIIYVNQKNVSLLSTVNDSIFETNSFLIGKKTNLIEYAAFYGSIQIFRYLYLNKNELLEPKLWFYVIHGRNPELIHLLEENQVKFSETEIAFESIKCHHNEITKYFKDNIIQNIGEESLNCDFISNSLKYLNFCELLNCDNFIEKFNDDNFLFFNLCQHEYLPIVQFLVNDRSLKLKKVIILNQSNIFITFLIIYFFNSILKSMFFLYKVSNFFIFFISFSFKSFIKSTKFFFNSIHEI